MKKTFSFLQKNMFYIIISIVGVAYILTGVSNITKTEETLESILAASGLGIVLGWFISALFGQQAIIDGYNDQDVVSALNTLGTEIEKINSDITNLSTYCEKENELTMIRKRTRILGKVGLNISVLDNLNKSKLNQYTKKQKDAIKKAFSIGYGYLTPDWLLADIEEEEEKDDRPTNVHKHTFKQNAYGLVTKVFTGIASASYIIEPFAKANLSMIIWRIFFFALWLLMGYFRYISDFNFMTKRYRKTVIKKTNEVIKFRNSLTNNKEWYIKEQPVMQEKKDNPSTEDVEVVTLPYIKNKPLGN